MKAALVHDWLNGMRGGEKVLELVCDIFPGAPIHTLFYEPESVSEKIRKRTVIPSPLQKFPFTRDSYRMYLPLYPWAIRRFDFPGIDVVFSISHCAAKGVRAPKGAIHICYCLTPMRYIWDKFHDYFGGKGLLSPTGNIMKALRKPLQSWDRATAERVDFFITTSRYVAERIRKYYGKESEIIPPPVNVDFFQPGSPNSGGNYGDIKPGGFYLLTSALVPYKRVDLAVEAFRDRPERLIVVGRGPEEKILRGSRPDNVDFTGWVSDEDLLWLYQNCRAFIFPAEEDFGIAPVEAMACGRPVIAYGKGGILDTVVENKTGLFFQDQTPASLKSALDRFSPDDFDPEVLRNHARRFSGQAFLNKIRLFLRERVGVEC